MQHEPLHELNTSLSRARPRKVFTLRELLMLMAGFGFAFGALAMVARFDSFLAVLVLQPILGVLVVAWVKRSFKLLLLGWAGVFVMILSAALLLPHIAISSQSGRRAQCSNNLRQIAQGLHFYHQAYGTFPPAYLADANGRPLHSWRVLILPFLEQQRLYAQYRFDEPWDGPNNAKLAAQFPMIHPYRCPSDDPQANPQYTSYLAVVGPQTAWPGEVGRTYAEFQDGTTNTIQLVEVAQSGIHWMEPRDLHVMQMNSQINAPLGQGPSSGHHPGGLNVLFADAHTQFFSDALTPEQLRALLTVDGQEPVDLDNW